ncbi:hypothetical protein G7Y89_g13276 [Cudoniella acicularis]|uniref:Uncharacterized protein n=1 Tax=Cudoniella acicularis TaxID=354080 RepID=A0A8H4RB17_9HELO|nr:hypothetical protein G7Y89_g13276 [Cudoniella acicularis]
MSSLDTFSLFVELPLELRIKIWGNAFPEPRVVPVRYNRHQKQYTSDAAPPVLLHICTESRDIFLSTYEKLRLSQKYDSAIFVDFSCDTIFFDSLDCSPEGDLSYDLATSLQSHKILSCAIDSQVWEVLRVFRYDALSEVKLLRNLKTIALVLRQDFDRGLRETRSIHDGRETTYVEVASHTVGSEIRHVHCFTELCETRTRCGQASDRQHRNASILIFSLKFNFRPIKMKVSLLSNLLFLPLPISAFAPRDAQYYNTKTIPSQVSNGSTIANFISSKFGLDGPQISAVNTTTWDWWYFDVIAPDLQTSMTVAFMTAVHTGFFSTPSLTNATTLGVFYRFANGTSNSVGLTASEVVVTTVQDGSSANYVGTGIGWTGSPDMETYTITFNSPENGLMGCFELKSIADAHCPCGPVEEGQNMMVAPQIGWANAVPDAVGSVDMVIFGSEFKFTGVAYHDKNWSNQPFTQNVASWYWGHGRLGPYSLVWFDTIAPNGSEYTGE